MTRHRARGRNHWHSDGRPFGHGARFERGRVCRWDRLCIGLAAAIAFYFIIQLSRGLL